MTLTRDFLVQFRQKCRLGAHHGPDKSDCIRVLNELIKAQNDVEQERVRLAGVLTVLEGHQPDPPVKQGDFGWSRAYEVAMEIRADLDEVYAGRVSNPAVHDIEAERIRQVTSEGWTPEHDDEHDDGELAQAAMCYACPPRSLIRHRRPGRLNTDVPTYWPWHWSWWKPCPEDRRRELVKAGALIVAEIERLDRITSKEGEE